jgi:predicted membrane protein (TIGR00267 family)
MISGEPKKLLLHIRRARSILRRYLVTNGFDGALTMLGLMVGFQSSHHVELPVALSACMGAAIALFMSGLSSAYLSESAERRKELGDLEQAMISDLKETEYGEASRYLPIVVALVNGASPFLISLLIMTPLWLALLGIPLPLPPFTAAIGIALLAIFLLGLFLGSIGRTFWLWAGLQTLAIAVLTVVIVSIANTAF